MYRLNWIFCNGSHWFKVFETEQNAIDYVHHCDLLRAYHVDRVWIAYNDSEMWLREKN